MEALAAIGLASNIASFLDFTCKLLAGAKTIYNSTSGLSEDSDALDGIVTEMRRLGAELLDEHGPVSRNSSPGLARLAAECEKTGKELSDALQDLKVKSRNRKWGSFQAALREVWKDTRITKLQNRLDSLRAQMVASLLNDMR